MNPVEMERPAKLVVTIMGERLSPRLLFQDVRTTAYGFGVPVNWFAGLVRDGKIPALHAGKQVLCHIPTVRKFPEDMVVPSPP